MKILNWVLLVTTLMIASISIANAAGHRGGNVGINNQTAYTFWKTQTTRNPGVNEFAPADIVEAGTRQGIYAEFYGGFASEGICWGTVTVNYNLKCPDGQLDEFQVRIDQRTPTIGDISVMPIGHEPHCIDLGGNDHLHWYWNRQHPSDTVTIRALGH